MLSNFGKADGGRETWAYNFIPRLVHSFPTLRLRLFGLRADSQPNNRDTVLCSVPSRERGRIHVHFLQANANRCPNALAFWRGIPQLVRRQGTRAPSLVIAVGSFVEHLAVLLTPSFRRAAKIVWLRSIFSDEKAHRYPALLRPALEWFELAVLRRADIIIANGEDTAEHYRKRGLSVTVIANGIEVERWRLPAPRLKSPLKIAFIGRLAPVKGIHEFLTVARSLAHERPNDFEFHVVGEGPGAAAQAGPDSLVHFQGAVPNEAMSRFLAGIDVTVQLGFAGRVGQPGGSGVSNALLEQAAARRVLVCWDNVAYRQVLDDTSCYFVPQGDLSALKATFARIIEFQDEARQKADAAGRVAEAYSFDHHMDLFNKIAAPWLAPKTETADVQL